MIGPVSPVAWNVYEVCPSDMFLQVLRFFPHGYEPRGCLYCVKLLLGNVHNSLNILEYIGPLSVFYRNEIP